MIVWNWTLFFMSLLTELLKGRLNARTVLDMYRNRCVQGHKKPSPWEEAMWPDVRMGTTHILRDDRSPLLLVEVTASGKRWDNPCCVLSQQQQQHCVSLLSQPRDVVWCLQLRPLRNEPAETSQQTWCYPTFCKADLQPWALWGILMSCDVWWVTSLGTWDKFGKNWLRGPLRRFINTHLVYGSWL